MIQPKPSTPILIHDRERQANDATNKTQCPRSSRSGKDGRRRNLAGRPAIAAGNNARAQRAARGGADDTAGTGADDCARADARLRF